MTFNTILISSLSPCSIELHDLTISISEHKISSAISMLPSTLPLLSVFFQLCLCCLQKLMFFFLLTSTSGWFYPFFRGHSLQRMHFLSSTSVFLILILPTSLLSGDDGFISVIYHIIFSHARLFCQTIMWTANLMVLVKVYSVADRSEVHRVKVRSCSGWQAKVGYYSIRSFFVHIVNISLALGDEERYVNGQVNLFMFKQNT